MTCAAPTITVGGVTLSTSDFENAKELIDRVGGDDGDPTLDGYDENIAGGNNSAGRSGVQVPNSPGENVATQTTPPGPIPFTPAQSSDSPGNGFQGSPVACIVPWDGNYDYQLSTNFKLRDFTINAVFPNQLIDYDATYTKNARFCFLQNLAENIAEPMRAKFGPFNINSGLRNKTSTSSGLSQHITGQALDIQFSGWTYARYWENAAWIRDNIPYDQFIFEHSSSTGLAWYHLSYNPAGNRAPSVSTKVMTMYRNKYSPGLKSYA